MFQNLSKEKSFNIESINMKQNYKKNDNQILAYMFSNHEFRPFNIPERFMLVSQHEMVDEMIKCCNS